MKADTDSRATDTRKKILDLAEDLMLGRGFNAFSYQHISAALGVRNAAIHYHFPKKTDLGIALIERYCHRFERYRQRHNGQDARTQLERYLELADRYYGQKQICPSGILSAELATLPEDMQQATHHFVLLMKNWAVDIVACGKEQGSMSYPGTALAMGSLISASMQGALQLARFDDQAILLCKQQIRDLLGIVSTKNNQSVPTRE